jgi:5-formyltetrahydrofolate cyclo-ligase
MGDSKSSIRALAAKLRNSLSAAEVEQQSGLVQDRALRLPVYLEATAIALYSATGNEVATEAIRRHALSTGKRIYFPRLTADAGLQWVAPADSKAFRAGQYGILEPTGNDVLGAKDAAGLVVFVPGLAFDGYGHRLGRGQGWYDRALATLDDRAVAVALAYEFQIMDRIPVEPWDRPVQFIVTEGRIIDCREDALTSGRVPESLSMKRGY